MEKYILVSCSDESMMIHHQEFNTLADAQKQMQKEWEEEDGDINNNDYVREFDALICSAYVHIWKIIKVDLG